MRYLWRGLLLLGLGGLGWGAWYLATHPSWGEPAVRQAQPALAMHARSLTVSGWQQRGAAAEKLWEVTARDVRASADGHAQWFRQITNGILFRDSKPIARFSAGAGEGDQAQNTFGIQGGARLRLESDGTTLATDQVQWLGPQRQLLLPRPVQLDRGSLHLEGSRAHLDLQQGHLTSESVTGHSGSIRFVAPHTLLHLNERRLELSPVQFTMPGGEAHAHRLILFADAGRFEAQEVQMKFLITPTAIRSTAATGLTLALLAAAHGAPAPAAKTHTLDVDGKNAHGNSLHLDLDQAVVKDQDERTTLTADHMVLEKDATSKGWQRIIATGHPRVWDDLHEVTGTTMTAYPQERRVVVDGNVRVVVKPKPGEPPPPEDGDLKSQIKEGVMTGDHLEYDYRNKNVAAQGHLKLKSRGRVVRGEKLFYTDKTQEVKFSGPVHAVDEKGQTFDSDEQGLTLALDQAGISHVPGKFTAKFFVQEEDEPTAPAPAGGKAADDKTKATPAPAAGKNEKSAQAPPSPDSPLK